MTTAAEREILRQADAIRREKNKVRRDRIKAGRTPLAKSRGRVQDRRHLAWIRRLPCVATWLRHGVLVYGCDAAHVRYTDVARGKRQAGMQRKPDDCWTLPLTREMHTEQHGANERAWWAALGIDPLDLCERLFAVSGDDARGLAVIQSLTIARAPR